MLRGELGHDTPTGSIPGPLHQIGSSPEARALGSQKAIAKWQDQIDVIKEELFPKYFK